MKRFLSGLLYFPIRRIPATMIGKPLGIQPAPGKAVHLPWLAEKAAGAAVFRSPAFVMWHDLGDYKVSGSLLKNVTEWDRGLTKEESNGHNVPDERRSSGSRPVAASAIAVVLLRGGGRVTLYRVPESDQGRKETRWSLLERPPEHSRDPIQDLRKPSGGIHDVHLFTIVSMAFIAEPPTYTINNTTSVANTKYSSPLKL